jgi:hypothetical protein
LNYLNGWNSDEYRPIAPRFVPCELLVSERLRPAQKDSAKRK